MSSRVSIGLIVHNEALNIRGCIQNILIHTDNIVIIDQSSTDNTVDIIRQELGESGKTWEVITTECKGYADPDRTLLLSKGMYDWMFLIDADERIPHNIDWEKLTTGQHGAVNFPMRSIYFNEDEKYGDYSYEECLANGKEVWEGYPDYHPRLLPKGTVWPAGVHERPTFRRIINAPASCDMLHLKTYEKQLEKDKKYALMFPEWAKDMHGHALFIQEQLNKPLSGIA